MQDFESVAAGIAIDNGYDLFICGHVHKPQQRFIENTKGNVIYFNCGDWVEHCTSLEFVDGKWGLYEHDGHQHRNNLSAEKKFDVVTDQVFYFEKIIEK